MRKIIQLLRTDLVNSQAVQALVSTRVYPQRVDLAADTNTYPSITISFIGGIPDRDNYEYNNHLLEFLYISDKSVDQCIKVYDTVNPIINKKYYKDATSNLYFRVTEDSKPVDFSGVFGSNVLYIYTNTYRIKAIG